MRFQGTIEYLLLVGGIVAVALVVGSSMFETTITVKKTVLPETNLVSYPTGDSVPPLVKLSVEPTSGTIYTIFSINCEASDENGVYSLLLFANDDLLKECKNCETLSLSTRLPEGNVAITCIALDTSNNASSDTVYISVRRPNQPPEITSFTADPSPAQVGKPVTLECIASDDRSLEKIEIYSTKNSSVPYKTCWVSGKTASCSTQITYSLASTVYPMCVAYDSDSASASKTIILVVKRSGTPPNVKFTVTPAEVNVNEPVTLSCTATDSDGISKIELYKRPGAVVKRCSGNGNKTLTCTTEATYSQPGNYTAVCTAWDVTNASASATATVQVTSSANRPPIVRITQPSDGDIFKDTTSVTVKWEVSDPDGDQISQIYVNCDGDSTIDKTLDGAVRSTVCQYRGEGNYVIIVSASDEKGSVGSDKVRISIVFSDSNGDEDSNVQLCTQGGWIWCPDCAWGSDGKVYFGYANSPVYEDPKCVGNDLQRILETKSNPGRLVNNVNALDYEKSSLVTIQSVAYVQEYMSYLGSCLYIDPDGKYIWVDKTETRSTSDGSIWTCTGFNSWIKGTADDSQDVCEALGGTWCPDCAWGSDGKVYFGYANSPVYEDPKCVGNDWEYSTVYTGIKALSFSSNGLVTLDRVAGFETGSCLYIDPDGKYIWVDKTETRSTSDGSIWTCTGFNSWIKGTADDSQDVCEALGGTWCPDCAWGSDGKVYSSGIFEAKNCVRDEYPSAFVANNIEVLFYTGELTVVNRIAKIFSSDYCVYVNEEGKYMWKPGGAEVTTEDGNTWTCLGNEDMWEVGKAD